jgi:hypothetical protein
VLTTGTGSGKSLAYIVPIVDAVLRERAANAGAAPGRYLYRDGTGLGGGLKSDDTQTLRARRGRLWSHWERERVITLA